jgi:endonuclease YncB( thermonuclease family)
MTRRRSTVIRFRRPRRWTRSQDFGRGPGTPRRAKGWRQAFSETRPVVLLIALLALWAIARDAALLEPPAFLQTAPETIAGSFTRCGPGRGHYCVIDGDTFKIGERKVRVVGIDTPEVEAQCAAEAAAAERATQALQAWLNRGPFRLTARIDEPTDRYGRALGIVRRVNPDGSEDRLADFMREGGYARRYLGGARGGWC